MRGGEGGVKEFVFIYYVYVQGVNTFHAREVKKWQSSVHVVLECPLMGKVDSNKHINVVEHE